MLAAGFSQPTLTRVQVGLVSLARELKGDLDRIAACADTGSSKGLHQLLQGEQERRLDRQYACWCVGCKAARVSPCGVSVAAGGMVQLLRARVGYAVDHGKPHAHRS